MPSRRTAIRENTCRGSAAIKNVAHTVDYACTTAASMDATPPAFTHLVPRRPLRHSVHGERHTEVWVCLRLVAQQVQEGKLVRPRRGVQQTNVHVAAVVIERGAQQLAHGRDARAAGDEPAGDSSN